MKYDLEIAKRLKSARMKAGFKTAKEFAASINTPAPTYQHHENGSRKLNAGHIVQYSRALNIHPAWITTGEEFLSVAQNSSEQESTKQSNDDELLIDFIGAIIEISRTNNCYDYQQLINIFFDIYKSSFHYVGTTEAKKLMLNNLIRNLKKWVCKQDCVNKNSK